MSIFKSIIPIIIFTIINSSLSTLLKKGFGKVLPLTFISSSFVLFFSQVIFKTFYIGIAFILLCFIFSIAILIKNKNNLGYVFTNGFYIFLLICIFFIYLDFGRSFFWDDEIGFWGKMVKEMYRLDKFYFVNESKLRGHLEYPPFITIFEMLWCKLSLGYSECNVAYSLHVFEFSLLIPSLFDNFLENRKKYEKIALNLVFVLISFGLFAYLDATDVINTIYVDTLIAIQFAYGIYLIYSDEVKSNFGIVCYILTLSMIIMTKQVGIAFCLLSVFYYFICNVKEIRNKKTIICLFGSVFSVIGLYFLWNKLYEPYEVVKQFDFAKISLSGFLDVFSKGGYQLVTIKKYINALFKTIIYNVPFPITFLSSFVVEVLLLELIKYKLSNKTKGTLFELACLVGTAGYALLMLVMYTFCYQEREAIVLGCYGRYMSSFTSALFISVALIFVLEHKDIVNKLSINNSLIALLLVISILCGDRLLDFAPQIITGNRFTSFEKLANKLDEMCEEDSTIFVIYDHDSADDYPAFLSYFSEKVYYTKYNRDLLDVDYSDEDKIQQIIDEFKNYDYVYVVDTSDSLNEYFGFMLLNNDRYQTNTLYKVNLINDNILLEIVK